MLTGVSSAHCPDWNWGAEMPGGAVIQYFGASHLGFSD
jgi:hypothetical protein